MWAIYLKELLELVRDRKTFIFTIGIPVFIIPLIFAGFGFLSSSMSNKARDAELAYAIFGQENAPQLAQRFADDSSFRAVTLASASEIKTAIADERIKFALVIPAQVQSTLAQHQQSSIALHYNSASAVDVTRRRVMAVIDAENQALRQQAEPTLGIDAATMRFVLAPITLQNYSTANRREQIGAIVGGMVPYLLLMVCLMAAMYPAIDTGAGEKERGTLETLLLAPVSRGAIVLAKFLMLFTVGLTSALLMIISLGAVLAFGGPLLSGEMAQMVRSITPLDLVLLALMLVPVAAMFAAVLLAISIYAKSYKEAAGLITPLVIVVILPTLVAMLPGVSLTWGWAMVPLTNVALAMKELIKGTMEYRMLSAILLSSTLSAAALLVLCRWWFNREQVLFRN